MRTYIIDGNSIAEGFGAYGTVFPSSIRPCLVLPSPGFAPFTLDPNTGALSISTQMAPWTPVDYMSGPHGYELTVVLNNTSILGLQPPHAWTIITVTVNVIEVGLPPTATHRTRLTPLCVFRVRVCTVCVLVSVLL